MSNDSLSRDRLYGEIRSAIRATDEISFKLMGLVPLVTGTAFLAFFIQNKDTVKLPFGVVVALALFAALTTLGVFRWELRNIQTCSWLLRRAEALEEALSGPATARPKPPLGIGKTEAEKWVYSVTILAWLALPALVWYYLDRGGSSPSTWALVCYVTSALLTAGATVISALTRVGGEPMR
jgi:DMSO reductase anchor subunit